jgi:hypothetical protein
VGDPISEAEHEREAVLDDLAQADEQHRAWKAERNRLLIRASALNISARRISQYVSLSDVGVGKLIKRVRSAGDVD